MTIGEIISDFRACNNMSLEDFGNRAGMSKSYVYALEKNEHPKTKEPINPSLGVIERVSKATGYSVQEIYSRLGVDEVYGMPTRFALSDIEMRIIDHFRAADDIDKQAVMRILGLK